MITVEHSAVIDRPVEEVFEFTTNVENSPQWQTWAQEAKVTSEGPLGVGARYTYVARFLGRRIESSGEVTAYEPNKRYAWRVTSGPVPAEADSTLETVEGGTKITIKGQGEPGGFFRLAEPITERMVKRQVGTDLDNLKDLLESRAEGSA